MQRQKNTVEQISEAFEYDHASSSNTWGDLSSMDDDHNFPDYMLSPSEGSMAYGNMVDQETDTLDNWNLGGSHTSEVMASQSSHLENKMNTEWRSSLRANISANSNMEARRMGEASILSLDNVNINLNIDQIEEDQMLQSSSSDPAAPRIDCSTGLAENSAWVSQSGGCPLYNPFISEQEQIPSGSCFTNSCGSSAGQGTNPSETDNGFGCSLGAHRLSGKRKNVEGFSGQSSGSGNTSCSQHTGNTFPRTVSARHISAGNLNISASSSNFSGAPLVEDQNLRSNTGTREGSSECSLNVGTAESSQRNFRMRINPGSQAHLSASNLWPGASSSSSRRPPAWSTYHPSALLIPLTQSPEARLATLGASSQNQSHVQSVPGMSRLVHPLTNVISSSQMGSSSNFPSNVSSYERSSGAFEEANFWARHRNDVSDNSMTIPATGMRHITREPTGWSLGNGSVGIAGTVASTSRGSSNSGVHISMNPARIPRQNRSTQYPHTMSEIVRPSFPTYGPSPGGNLNDFLPQHSGHSSSPQEPIRQVGVSHCTHQLQFLRSAFLMDRRNEVLGNPIALRMLAAAREGRGRMLSEHIRNTLDLMRRGENIRFEDVLILDQSAFYGLADVHDRHRDMRLDVDNMSYEELLALEERIGNVSTGLSGETILKHLRQRKYAVFSGSLSTEVEPCCICQENFLDDEDIGTLDCGHDFHTACIKQWLTYKNICPICKMTALVTEK